MTPVILHEGNYTHSDLNDLRVRGIWKELDIYKSQLTELFEISHADLLNNPDYDTHLNEFIRIKSEPDYSLRGNYVYYPWSGLLLHLVSADELKMLRTNRTNNLITRDEQLVLGNFTAGIAGLSFGNGIALALVYGGFSDTVKIADTDIFETTNLNRVRVGLPSVGRPKTRVTSEEIYEINPYAQVEVFDRGLNEENLDQFVNGDSKLDTIFDVVDDFSMKVRLRLAAKKSRIPVVMLTSLEDSVLIDVERYDLQPDAEPFHGLLGPVTEDLLHKKMTEQEKAKYALAIVGADHVSYRNLVSLSEVGKSLVSRPHLYSTVSIVCGLAGYIAKRIALNEEMPSIRKHMQFNEVLGIMPNKDDTPENRQKILNMLLGTSENT